MNAFSGFLAHILLNFLIITSLTAQTGSWQEEVVHSGAPNPRHEAGFVELGNKFYLLGGRGIKPVDIYDPQTKSWTQGQTSPIELHHFQPIAYQGKIYGIGAMTGRYPTETPVPNIIIYDPATDNWSTGPEIPAARRRGGAGLVLHNDKFYLVCGIINGHTSGHVNWLDVFDPATNSWQVLADAPRARDHFQASVIDGKIYALAGRRSTAGQNVFGNTVKEIDVYDIATNQWTTLNQDLPTERAGSFNAIHGKEIWVMGGESPNQTAAHSELEALDTRTGNWRSLSNMIQGRHGTGAVWYQDTLYSASGSGNRGGGPELASIEKFHLGGNATNLSPEEPINPFSIQPNPNDGTAILIEYDGPLRNLKVELFTLSGSKLAEEKGINEFPFNWNLAEQKLTPGLYLFKIGNENNSFSQKVMMK